jgi:hypothetical protein
MAGLCLPHRSGTCTLSYTDTDLSCHATTNIFFHSISLTQFYQTYDLYCKVSTDQAVVRQRKLRKQVLQLRTELSQTSSQDQFAKWAKIRRKYDSTSDSLEKTSKECWYGPSHYTIQLTCPYFSDSEIAMKRSAFEVKVKGVLYFVVHGSQVLTVMWFRKSPVFYLPNGWFGPAAWLLSMPFSPRGTLYACHWVSRAAYLLTYRLLFLRIGECGCVVCCL